MILEARKWKMKKTKAVIGPRVNQSSTVAGRHAKYGSKNGTAPSKAAKTAGR